MKLLRLIPVCGLLLLTAACGVSGQEGQIARERHSCATLGIDPGSEAFSGCVANLDASMTEANNPAYR